MLVYLDVWSLVSGEPHHNGTLPVKPACIPQSHVEHHLMMKGKVHVFHLFSILTNRTTLRKHNFQNQEILLKKPCKQFLALILTFRQLVYYWFFIFLMTWFSTPFLTNGVCCTEATEWSVRELCILLLAMGLQLLTWTHSSVSCCMT